MGNTPSITLVTPVFNKAAAIGRTIESVLGQQYPALEFIIVDGGSTDGTLDQVAAAGDRATVLRGPDEGHAHAIEKGFKRGSGSIMGWLNGGDILFPGALSLLAEIFEEMREVNWLGSLTEAVVDEKGRIIEARMRPGGFTKKGLLLGETLPQTEGLGRERLADGGVFWRRELWEKAGASMDSTLQYAAELDLWLRFFKAGAEFHAVSAPLIASGAHHYKNTEVFRVEFFKEAQAVLERHGGGLLGKSERRRHHLLHKWERSLRKRKEEFLRGNAPALHAHGWKPGWRVTKE